MYSNKIGRASPRRKAHRSSVTVTVRYSTQDVCFGESLRVFVFEIYQYLYLDQQLCVCYIFSS